MRKAARRFGQDFAQASDAQRRAIFDAIAFRDKVQPGYEQPAQFFARLRGLMLGGFYSLPEGMADIGYMGNTPMTRRLSGPDAGSDGAFECRLAKLGLKPLNPG